MSRRITKTVTFLINFSKLAFLCVNFKRHFGSLPTETRAFVPNSQIITKLHTIHFNKHLTYSIYVGLIAITLIADSLCSVKIKLTFR